MFNLDFYKLAFFRQETLRFMSIEYRNEFKEIDNMIEREINRLVMNNSTI